MEKLIIILNLLVFSCTAMESGRQQKNKKESQAMQNSLKKLDNTIENVEEILKAKTARKKLKLEQQKLQINLQLMQTWLMVRKDFKEEKRFHFNDEPYIQKTYGLTLKEVAEFTTFKQKVLREIN